MNYSSWPMTDSATQPPRVRIHSIAPYDRGAKARWLLTEIGVPFDTRWLDREKREHEGHDFLRLNPMGRVPVMEIGDQVLFESGAICAHLGDLFTDRGIAPPLGSPQRTDYQQWMYFAAATLDAFQARIMIIEDIPPGELQTSKLEALQSDLREALLALEQTLAKGPYLLGSRFTAADICVSYHLYWCRLWPELDEVFQDFSRVRSYLERLESMPSAVSAKVFSYPG